MVANRGVRESPPGSRQPLNTLNSNRPLTIQPLSIPLMTLLLTILQPITLMILQHPMLSTIMSLTETAIPNDPLRSILTRFITAADLLRGHTAPKR